jgi:ferric-dicitrate binding protein FerR (iron transport regulator)
MSARQPQFSRRRRFPLYMKKRRNWQPVALTIIVLILIASGISYYVAGRHHTRSSILASGHHYTTFQCAYGERKLVKLADSTLALLNSRSTLYVPQGFPNSTREVILDGEAFFGVRKQQPLDFVVKTDKLKTHTKGSTFRIRSLECQSGATLYVMSGTADVSKSYHSPTDNATEHLASGEMILANKEIDLMEKETFTLAEQQDCLDGKFVFHNTPVHAAFKQIGDWFGVEMEFRGGNGNLPEGISGEFRNRSLEGLLAVLGDSVGFSYRIKRDKVVIRF